MELILTGICIFLLVIYGLALVGVFIIQCQMYLYLKKHHRSKWEEITTVGKSFGPGWCNSYRGLNFLMSPDNFDDPMVERFKKRMRYAILGLIIYCGSFPVLIIAMIIIYNLLKEYFSSGSI